MKRVLVSLFITLSALSAAYGNAGSERFDSSITPEIMEVRVDDQEFYLKWRKSPSATRYELTLMVATEEQIQNLDAARAEASENGESFYLSDYYHLYHFQTLYTKDFAGRSYGSYRIDIPPNKGDLSYYYKIRAEFDETYYDEDAAEDLDRVAYAETIQDFRRITGWRAAPVERDNVRNLTENLVLPPGQKRYALVIGNGNYNELGRLSNPPNDARDIASSLEKMGFEVELLVDADLVTMENGVIDLERRLSQDSQSIGFFYYAGHGVQSQGVNYLVPTGGRIGSESFLRTRTLSMDIIMESMNMSGNELNIFVLDACRDNPFGWNRSGKRGLVAASNQPADSILVYATSAGSVAQDGEGRNGLFTSALLEYLTTPGLEISEVFRKTGAAVKEWSRDQQIPAVYNQFFGQVYLAGE